MPLVEHAGKFLIADALKAYSENFRLLSSDNPYLFSLNGQTYSAHVSETHFAARDNRDEYRIQIPRVVRETQRRRMGTGTRPVFLGYLQERGGFLPVGSQPTRSRYVRKMSAPYTFLGRRFFVQQVNLQQLISDAPATYVVTPPKYHFGPISSDFTSKILRRSMLP